MTITVNEKQAQVIKEALDAYSRLFTGQVSIALEFVYYGTFREKYPNMYVLRELEKKVNKELFPELDSNAYYGIMSPLVDNRAKIAFDLFQQIREFQNPKDRILLNTSGEAEITIKE